MDTTPPPLPIIQVFLERKYRDKGPLRTLWLLCHGQRLRLLLALIFFLIKQTPVWVMPLIASNVINAITQPTGDTGRTLMLNGIVLLVLIVQNVPMHTLYAGFLSRAVRNLQLTLRSAMVTRLQQLSIAFHDDIQAGRLQAKVLRDVDAIEALARQTFNGLLYSAMLIVIAFSITIYKRPMIAGFFLLTVPVAVLLIRIFARRISKQSRAYHHEVESMSAAVSEMIEMIPVTRAHAAEDKELRRVERHLDRLRQRGLKLDIGNELFASSTWACFNGFQFLCLFVSAYMAWKGYLTVGEVVLYQGLFSMIVGSVNSLLVIYPSLQNGMESIKSIGEVLECPDIELNEGKRNVPKVEGRLTFENLEFRYPNVERPALSEVNLDIRAGECVAFVGESGSGKSTLMNLVIGFRRPTAGRILLDGQNMADLNLREYRRCLAVVPQQTVLFSGTIRDNITYGLERHSEERLQEVIDAANVREFIEKLPDGLNTRIGSRGNKLSGGQRQRIAIARALLRDPRLIILDEATSALDVVSERLVQEAINRLIAGRTTLIVAHRLSTIRHANRVVVMGDGKILEVGPPDELEATGGAFAQLRALQV